MSEVVVVGTGARTPVGLRADSTASAVRAGISNFAEFPFVMTSGDPVIVAADPVLDTRLEGHSRVLALAEAALREVLETLPPGDSPLPCHVLLALPEPRPGFSDDDAARVTEGVEATLRALGLQGRVVVAGRGHAGGAAAVEMVQRAVAAGRDDLFVVLGADSYHHPATFMWLEADRRFAQPTVRGGFIPGEGAGALALASASMAAAHGWSVAARVEGLGRSQESLLRASETGSVGVGMSAAVRGATRTLRLPHEAVDVVYADINGERYRSEEWGFMGLKLYELFRSLEYEAPASSWGDVGAASLTLFGTLAVESFRRSYAKGPRALLMAGSDGGSRGVLLLTAG